MSTVPATMTAIMINGKGGPDVLVPREVAVPQPGAGQILVKVAAAGVNRPDVLQRKGLYPAPKGHSEIPGLEIAGDVVAVGQGTARFKPGDRVMALVNGGGYAQYCAVAEPQALPIPPGLDLVSAAGIPETFFTVWHNVFERGALKAGEWFMIHGGTSGIGGGKGADLIIDMVGGDYVDRNLDAAAVEGRIVQIATQKGFKVEMNLVKIMQKRLTLTGSTLRPRPVADKAAIADALREKVWPLLSQGKIKPVIDSTFALAEANKAHARMESSNHVGKIVLTA